MIVEFEMKSHEKLRERERERACKIYGLFDKQKNSMDPTLACMNLNKQVPVKYS